MSFLPDFQSFAARYAEGAPQIIYTKMIGDLETPVSAFLKCRDCFEGVAFLLESVEGGAARGRYSIIGLEPDLHVLIKGGQAEIHEGGIVRSVEGNPLDVLREVLGQSKLAFDNDVPPMSAGLFGHMGYDIVRLMERLPDAKPDLLGVPDAHLVRPTVMVVFDSVKDTITLATAVWPKPAVTAKMAHEAAMIRLEKAMAAIEGPMPMGARSRLDPQVQMAPAQSNTTPDEYRHMVDQAKEFIRAGDIFQVVLSQRFSAPFPLSGLALYRALRRVNPSPYLCYLDYVDYQIVCSSPEILVRVHNGEVTIRPIAGTRPRGATPSEDKANAESLLADEKELAEHLMLLDLGRNDVGRVAEIGSVRVEAQFFLEYYSHVMHIVSDVRGKLGADFDRVDALAAGFPAGTVSGAPKIRAMEIIDALEKDKRGPYAGCIGYFGADGSMDTCIVLRTAIVKDGMMHVQAGAGIVADSNPQSEQDECVNKAKALFRAANVAIETATQGRRGQ
jgi:anthranilate synthase component I